MNEQLLATGKLYNRFNHIKTVKREEGLLKREDSVIEDNFVPPPNTVVEKLNNLSTCLDPWVNVVILWKETWSARKQLLANRDYTIQDYTTQFACLKNNKAIDLFNSDFEQLYPNHSTLMLDNWPKVKNYLYAKLKSAIIPNSEKQELISFPNLSSGNPTSNLFNNHE